MITSRGRRLAGRAHVVPSEAPHAGRGPAQRLWVLERPDAGALSDGTDACRFAGAIAVLGKSSIDVVFVRSTRMQGTEGACLENRGLRLDIQRDALHFATLDAAIAWADATKQAWMRRGWTEAAAGPDEL